MIKITGKFKELNEYVVYVIYSKAKPNEALFVGGASVSTVLEMREFRRTAGFNYNDEYEVVIIESFSTLEEAIVSAGTYRIMYSPTYSFTTGKSAVKCIETGEMYKSGYAAAKAMGLSWSALSNHLNNKPGFKTVKGFTFVRV